MSKVWKLRIASWIVLLATAFPLYSIGREHKVEYYLVCIGIVIFGTLKEIQGGASK